MKRSRFSGRQIAFVLRLTEEVASTFGPVERTFVFRYPFRIGEAGGFSMVRLGAK